MTNKRMVLVSLVFLTLLIGNLAMNSFCFPNDPIHTDPSGDQGAQPTFTDIEEIWVDNSATHIQFKVNLNSTWNENGWAIFTYISINDFTGSNNGGAVDFLADYRFMLWIDGPNLDFADFNDAGNDLDFTFDVGLSYHAFSNNNETLEWGYKLQTYSGGKGYLNVSIGQTIKFKLVSGGDTDEAPDLGEDPLSYTLELDEGGKSPLLILLIILFPISGVAIGLFIYYRNKDVI